MRAALILTLLLLPALILPTVARAAPPRHEVTARYVLPEESRWLSFVRLVESRWRERTTVLENDSDVLARQYDQCVEDAWQLALFGLVDSPKAPCAMLLVDARPRRKGLRADDAPPDYRRRFEGALVSPSRAEFAGCTDAALALGDASLLATCALALRPRAAMFVSLDDPHRFGAWMDGCKRVMIPAAPAAPKGEKGAAVAPVPPSAEADAHARHCLRNFPTLYEIQWMKKLSDFWTPEEQRALNARSRQLGQGADAD